MKVLSEIYSYSKDKSAVVFNAGSANESSKNKKNVSEGSWFSKTWNSTPSLTSSTSWFSKMSIPKYQIPKYSFPKYSSLHFSFPKMTLPKCSFPKFSLPTAWLKSVLVKLEETRVSCYLYLIELVTMLKEKSSVCLSSCSCLNYPCLQFNSNPEYVDYPWYKRVIFTVRDNLYSMMNLNKESVNSGEDSEEDDGGFDKKGSKAKVDEERNSRAVVKDDKYNMKHSQSSKYSNDLTTLRSSKKLKKTNTDDLKNGEEGSATTKHTAAVFSMFSKSDVESKSPKVSSPVNKSGSLYVDANEDKYGDTDGNTNVQEITGEESIPGSNETSEEKTKFNIKNTWDKFSKIIS